MSISKIYISMHCITCLVKLLPQDVHIVDMRRTAFSRSRPTQPERDVFNSLRMDEASGMLIKDLIKRNGIKPEEIGDVITGSALQADENWTYGGRHQSFLSLLSQESCQCSKYP